MMPRCRSDKISPLLGNSYATKERGKTLHCFRAWCPHAADVGTAPGKQNSNSGPRDSKTSALPHATAPLQGLTSMLLNPGQGCAPGAGAARGMGAEQRKEVALGVLLSRRGRHTLCASLTERVLMKWEMSWFCIYESCLLNGYVQPDT